MPGDLIAMARFRIGPDHPWEKWRGDVVQAPTGEDAEPVDCCTVNAAGHAHRCVCEKEKPNGR